MAMVSERPPLGAVERPALETGDRLYCAADIAALPSDLPSGPARYELDNGRLITMAPPGDDHGVVEARLVYFLIRFGEDEGYGSARSGESGILLWRNPDRVVGADAAFVCTHALPVQHSPEGYLETIPDIVVEVVSKNDTRPYVQRKAADYLLAGVRMVWLADPASRTITVWQPGLEPKVLGEDDTLTAGDIIPGLQVLVRKVFP